MACCQPGYRLGDHHNTMQRRCRIDADHPVP